MSPRPECPPASPKLDSPELRSNLALAVLIAGGLLLGISAGLLTPKSPTKLTAETVALRIDPNTATAAELELLPGVGPAVAENIITYRETRPPGAAFQTIADLDAVRRIGPKTIERLGPSLALPAEPPSVP